MNSDKSPPAGDRLHALDAVRAFALLLGVAHHAALSFVPMTAPGTLAPTQDVSTSLTLTLLAFTGHMFRMSLFFLLAGFFARMLIQRSGVPGFVRNRLVRIGLPLLAAWLLLMPLVTAAWDWSLSNGARGLSLAEWSKAYQPLSLSYLWFLYYLLVIYGLTLLLRGVLLRTGSGPWIERVNRGVYWVLENRWAAVLLAVPMFVGLLRIEGNAVFSGVPTPSSLLPEHLSLFVYSVAFGVGWLVHRNRRVLEQWRAQWKGQLVAAVLFTFPCALMVVEDSYTGANNLAQVDRVLFAACYSIACWCWTLGITGCALRFLSSASAKVRYVADASYWTYLVHYPVVLFLQGALGEVDLNWSIKFPAIIATALAFSLLTYRYLVRYTVIGRVLNGDRQNRRKPSAAPVEVDSGELAPRRH